MKDWTEREGIVNGRLRISFLVIRRGSSREIFGYDERWIGLRRKTSWAKREAWWGGGVVDPVHSSSD
jgi:hypothetical protein